MKAAGREQCFPLGIARSHPPGEILDQCSCETRAANRDQCSPHGTGRSHLPGVTLPQYTSKTRAASMDQCFPLGTARNHLLRVTPAPCSSNMRAACRKLCARTTSRQRWSLPRALQASPTLLVGRIWRASFLMISMCFWGRRQRLASIAVAPIGRRVSEAALCGTVRMMLLM